MKSVIAVLLATLSATCFAGDAKLLGCWRSESGTGYLADGSSRRMESKCTLEFTGDTIESSCVGNDGPFTITYAYRVIKPGAYEATIIRQPSAPQFVGNRRNYEYRVDSDFLFVTTYPQTDSPATSTPAVKFESRSVRAPGACPQAAKAM